MKINWKNDVRMVWLCEFRGSMNGWDLKILYRDLKSWKKLSKKNGMVWRIRKVEKNEKTEWNVMIKMGGANK